MKDFKPRDEKQIREWILENDPNGKEFLSRLDAAVETLKNRPPLTPDQVKALMEAEDYSCSYCGRCVLAGPPCCEGKVKEIEHERLRPILINQARKRDRRVWKRAHRRFMESSK